MNKLELERNGTKVDVIEIANISDKEQLVVGNYDRDLILRTKGNIHIQVHNKFFDLLGSENSLMSSGFKPIFIDDINSQAIYPDGSLIIETSTEKLYAYYNNELIPLSDKDNSISGYLSYAQNQDLDSTQIIRALNNLGYYWDGVTNKSFFEDQLLFNVLANTHQIYKNNELHDLYLLLTGGTVIGNTKFKAGLIINSLSDENLINPKIIDFKGLTISTNDEVNGYSLYTTDNLNVIHTLTGRPLVFRGNDLDDETYKEVIRIDNTGIGINGLNKPQYNLTGNGISGFDELDILISLKSQAKISRIGDYDTTPGFIFAPRDLDLNEAINTWELEVDRVFEKHPSGKYNVSQHYFLNYIKKGYSIKSLTEGVNIEFHDDSGLNPGDILMGIIYNWNNYAEQFIFVTLGNKIIDPGDTESMIWEASFTGEFDTRIYTKLVKIGGSTVKEDLIIDSTKQNIKVVDQITNFNSIFPNGRPRLNENDEKLDFKNTPIYPSSTINSVLGNLNEVIDEDLFLNQNEEYGLYSNNAYIKGKADLDYLKLGIELLYKDDILYIKDLEILKNRRVDGANGLEGGGKLIDADIVISHSLGSWVNKTPLSNNNFISNLIVDQYGHITDWVTRTVTTTNIPEGSNLYYTDDRVKALFPNYTLLTGITSTNINNWNTGYDNSLTNVTFNPTSGLLTFVRPSSDLTVTIPIGGTANLSLGTLTDTTMPILNSAGTGVTLVAATDTTAGLITADTTNTQELAGNKSLSGILTLKQAPLLSYSELRMLGPNNYIRTNNLSNMSINANNGIYFQIAGSTTASIFADYLKIDKYIKMTGPQGWQGGIMFETSPGVDAGVIVASGVNDMWIRNGSNGGVVKIGDTYHSNQKVLLEGPIYLNSQQGSGVRMVTVAANGLLSSQPITSGGSWGSITGTLSNQTDLQNALNAKEPVFSKGNLLSGEGVNVVNGSGVLVGSSSTINILSAAMNSLGGIKLWSNSVQTDPAQGIVSMAGRTYGVQLNSSGQAVVNVPWTSGSVVGEGGFTAGNGITLTGSLNNRLIGPGNIMIASQTSWGSIVGTLSDQSDLQNALNTKENSFSKGSIIQGSNVTITGNLTDRLVGAGDITISATGGGGGSQNLQQTTDIGNQTSNYLKITNSNNAPTGNGLYFNYESASIAGIISVNRDGSSNPSRIEIRNTSIRLIPSSGFTPTLTLDNTATASGAFAGRVSGAGAVLNNEFVTRKQNHSFATLDYTGNAITPNINDTNMVYSLLSASGNITLNTPTGGMDNSKMIIRVRSSVTRSITWGADYRSIGFTLPTTLPANKIMYVGFVGNMTDSKWDVIALQIES